jgi:hypothetical protein
VHSESASEVRLLIERNLFDWDHPLSARAFSRWHDHLNKKSDEVTRLADRFRLETRTDEGMLRRADFEVHADDFHPIQESLDFGKAGVVEISEIGELPPVASRLELDRPITPTLREAPVKAPATSNSEPQLDDIEAGVRMLLHSVGADLKDSIIIQQTENSVELSGIVSDVGRKDELVQRLTAIDHRIDAQIQTVEEAAASAIRTAIAPPVSAAEPLFDPPAKSWLEEKFPDGNDRERFVLQALQLSRDASIRVYALTQLVQRYPPASFGVLSSEPQGLISRIIADDAVQLKQIRRELREHLEPLTGAIPPGPSVNESWPTSVQRCATGVALTLDKSPKI